MRIDASSGGLSIFYPRFTPGKLDSGSKSDDIIFPHPISFRLSNTLYFHMFNAFAKAPSSMTLRSYPTASNSCPGFVVLLLLTVLVTGNTSFAQIDSSKVLHDIRVLADDQNH